MNKSWADISKNHRMFYYISAFDKWLVSKVMPLGVTTFAFLQRQVNMAVD